MRRLPTALLLAGPLSVLLAGQALAATGPELIEGNVVTCAQAGLDGEMLIMVDASASGENAIIKGTVHGPDNTLLDVELLDDSWTITGVVIKGGNAANVYTPPPPYTGLTSPTNAGANVAAISHWFVCGEKTTPSPSPSPTPSETPSETPSPTETPTPSPTKTAGSVVVPTAVPAGSSGATGGGGSWQLLGVAAGTGLVAAGAGLGLRRRRGHAS
jgi:hypothetical protein